MDFETAQVGGRLRRALSEIVRRARALRLVLGDLRRIRAHAKGQTHHHLVRLLDRPIRTLVCGYSLNWEGAPRSQCELVVRLRERQVVDPVVHCPRDGPLRAAYEDRGIRVRVGPDPLAAVRDGAAFERGLAALAEVMRSERAEVVYANTVHTFYAVAAAESLGLPSVWNIRESEPWSAHFAHFHPRVARHALESFRHAYRVVFVSEATRRVYRGRESAKNFTVIPNALNPAALETSAMWTRERARASLGIAPDEVVLLLLGTVCERKGQLDLPRAVGRLPARLWTRVRCFIVGERPGLPYGGQVSRTVAALPPGLRDRVAVLPETDEPARYYRAADVFICTSRVESHPRVILEAMAYELPIVTTPVFGIREQVREGVNALFYRPGDVRGLAEALAALIDDKERRRHLADNARLVFDSLTDFESMVEAYAAILGEAYLNRSPEVA